MAFAMKLSVNISVEAGARLDELTQASRCDRSAVIEAAILLLAMIRREKALIRVREALDAKSLTGPAGWRSHFWSALADEFGMPADVFAFDVDQPYGPRTVGGTQVVFLLSARNGKEDGNLVVHAFENLRADSVSAAACVTGDRIRERRVRRMRRLLSGARLAST